MVEPRFVAASAAGRRFMVSLRRPTLRDEKIFLRAVRESRALHKGLVSPPGNSEDYRKYVNSLRRKNRIGFFVTPPDSSDIAGVVNVSEIVRGLFQSGYLGYYAFSPHAGRGLMWQGMQQVLAHCFNDLRLHRLEANIQPENERSIELVKALGFSKEGYSPRYLKVCGKWRDHERWAIRVEQWR
jgi:ribosomal-protein-alanine N-acetyltransferase